MLWKKIAATVAAAVGLAAAGAAPVEAQDLRSLIESPNVNKCADEFLITVPGGGNTVSFLPEKFPVGPKVTEVATGVFKATRGTVQPVWIAYNATPFTLLSYNDSSNRGYWEASGTMRRLARMCPKATFSITGYSEGADIGSKLLNNIGHGRGPVSANRVNSALLISNPHLGDNGGAFTAGATRMNRGALEHLEGGYGELGPRVLDMCRLDDPICALPPEWHNHVDPFLRMATLRGQVPVTEFAAIVARRSPTTLPLVLSVYNHGQYGGPMIAEGIQWIVSRQAPIRNDRPAGERAQEIPPAPVPVPGPVR